MFQSKVWPASLPFHHCVISICFINQNGQECFKINKDLTDDQFSEWTLDVVKTVVHEDKLTVRCNFFDENIHVQDMFAKMEISTQTEIPTLKETGSRNLAKDFEKFYDSGADTDFLLKVGDAKFPVHRAVLAARSPVFAAMFHHKTLENANSEANINDVDEDTLKNLLRYIYSGKIQGLTTYTAVSIFQAADMYDLRELRDECLRFLMHNLEIENFCGAALLAHMHAEEILEKKVVDFIDNNIEQVLDSDELKNFFSTKPAVAGKYICTAYRGRACKTSKMINND